MSLNATFRCRANEEHTLFFCWDLINKCSETDGMSAVCVCVLQCLGLCVCCVSYVFRCFGPSVCVCVSCWLCVPADLHPCSSLAASHSLFPEKGSAIQVAIPQCTSLQSVLMVAVGNNLVRGENRESAFYRKERFIYSLSLCHLFNNHSQILISIICNYLNSCQNSQHFPKCQM